MPNYTPSDSFRNASTSQKIAFLSAKSPSFAKATPQQQADYINGILGNKGYTAFEQNVNATGAADNFDSDPNAGPIRRFANSAIHTVLGAPAAIGHAVFDPLTPEEEADFQGHTRIPGEVTLERLSGARGLVDAARTYANPATRPSLDQIESVLPEALGQGVGAYAGGKLLGKTAGLVTNKIGPGIARGLMDESGTEPKPIVKLALGNERANTLADIAEPERVAAKNRAAAQAEREAAMDKAAKDAMPQSVPSQTRYGQFLQDDADARKPVPVTQSPSYESNRAAQAADAEARKPVPVNQSPYFNQNQDAAAAATEARKPINITNSPYFQDEAYRAGRTASGVDQAGGFPPTMPATEDFYSNRGQEINDVKSAQDPVIAKERKPVPIAQSPNMSGEGAAAFRAGRKGPTPPEAPPTMPFTGATPSTAVAGPIDATPSPSATSSSFRTGSASFEVPGISAQGGQGAVAPPVEGEPGTGPQPKTVPDQGSVLHLPEPRPFAPGAINLMNSIPRDQLLPAAQRGQPGAIDQMRDLAQPAIIIPKEATGYGGPRPEAPSFPPSPMPAIPSEGGAVAPASAAETLKPSPPATQGAPAFSASQLIRKPPVVPPSQ